jgi:cytochrome c peroxidase
MGFARAALASIALTALFRPLAMAQAETPEAAAFTLSERCPPGFEKLDDGRCRLHTIYDQYDSLYDRGVGGLRTALPPRRDRFTAEQIDLAATLFDPAPPAWGRSCGAATSRARLQRRPRPAWGGGHRGPTPAPTLWNVASCSDFLGRLRRSLEEHGPLYAAAEMGTTPRLLQTLMPRGHRIIASFPRESGDTIALTQIYTALAAFEASLISLGSRYDHYANGDPAALSAQEIEGFNVFRSFVARCAECHTPPLFTNQQIAVIGVPDGEGRPFDPGAAAVSDNPTWRGGFKVPTLRNIASTAPYMHAGQFATLREAAEFYTQGRGHAVPSGEKLVLHWHIWQPELRDDELDRLVDFMKALTDESFTPQIPPRVPSGLEPVGQGASLSISAKGSE